jgi:hypothetical protein
MPRAMKALKSAIEAKLQARQAERHMRERKPERIRK